MKLYINIIIIAFSSLTFAQNSIGINYHASAISDAYIGGVGLNISGSHESGNGFGYWASLTYLVTDSSISDVIDYGLQYDFAAKWDFALDNNKNFRVYPSAGIGWLNTQFADIDPDTEYYFLAGAGLLYNIGGFELGLDGYNAFVDNSDFTISISARFVL